MMNYSKLIDDYLLGSLSGEDQIAFEKELAISPQLRKEVKLCKELKESIYEDDIYALREKLSKAQGKFSKDKTNRRIQLFGIISAASVLLIFGVKIFMADSTPSYERLYQKHYEPYKIIGNSRGDSNINSTFFFEEVVKLYTNGEYDQVVAKLGIDTNKYPNDLEASIMLSVAYLETSRAEKAEEVLNKISFNGDNILYDEVKQWYLALSILRQGRIQDAKNILEGISNERGHYSKQASSILHSLKK
jgi:hypothetical protein